MDRYRIISLLVLFGLPIFFLVITFITGNWGFFLWSIPPSMLAGLTGYFNAKNRDTLNE